MEEVKINISSVYFPTQFVSDSDKKKSEYGLQIGQAIQYEWLLLIVVVSIKFYPK